MSRYAMLMMHLSRQTRHDSRRRRRPPPPPPPPPLSPPRHYC
jgi:hypothetical protein